MMVKEYQGFFVGRYFMDVGWLIMLKVCLICLFIDLFWVPFCSSWVSTGFATSGVG